MNKYFKKATVGALSLAMVFSMVSNPVQAAKNTNSAKDQGSNYGAFTQTNSYSGNEWENERQDKYGYGCSPVSGPGIEWGDEWKEQYGHDCQPVSGPGIEWGDHSKDKYDHGCQPVSGPGIEWGDESKDRYGHDYQPVTGSAIKAHAVCSASGTLLVRLINVKEYKDVSISITDDQNNEVSASISKVSNDVLKASLSGLTEDVKYTAVISGLVAYGSSESSMVTVKFVAKDIKTRVRCKDSRVKVNAKGTVKIALNSKAAYSSPSITVTNSKGKEVSAKIIQTNTTAVTAQIKKYSKKSSYKIIVNGIKSQKDKNYGSVTVSTKK